MKKEVIFIYRYYEDEIKIDGYYTIVEYTIEPIYIKMISWLIPEKLFNNKHVMDSMKRNFVEEFVKSLNDIVECNHKLNYKYLDIERKPLLDKKDELKESCYQILKRMNADISPYHWEIQNDPRANQRNCYIVALFKGEDTTERMIRDL